MSANHQAKILVVLMDGTFASLDDGRRSSVGQIHQMLRQEARRAGGADIRIHYAAGQQWNSWRTLPDLMMGEGLSARIIHAYRWLAVGYRPGDQIFLFGYSRGAFAVRSLAGMIGQFGLLRPGYANERFVRLAWRYYQQGGDQRLIRRFTAKYARDAVPIRMVGCFDTVMALGIRLPLLWALTEPRFRFHDTQLGANVDYGFHALALDETRAAFAPILWDDSSAAGHIEQLWFSGAHADIGGQLSGLEFARPLANIPLVWMLERAQFAGLPLPASWTDGLICNPQAPSVGSWRRWGKAFLARAPRVAGQHATESLHWTVSRPYQGTARLKGAMASLTAPRNRKSDSRDNPDQGKAAAKPG